MAEQKFNTSFIPKKPIQTTKKGGAISRSKGSGFFSAISLFIFIVTIIIGVGVYFYGVSLQARINGQEKDLLAARDAFDPNFVTEATRLNDRLESVKKLVANHTSPSQVFDLLENTTLDTVRFSSLNYATLEDGTVAVQASGLASGFQSIVLQSDEYGNTGTLRDVLFSNLQPNQVGSVSFTFESTVDPRLILYRNSLSEIIDSSSSDPEPEEEELEGLDNLQ